MRSLRSQDVRQRALARHKGMQTLRQYFDGAGFIEIDSHQLISANCVEAHIDPMSLSVEIGQGRPPLERYLHTSPEIFHKRLLSHGLEKIYQLSHVYRDGEMDRTHLPEFSLAEWYRAGGSLDDLIADTEALLFKMALALAGSPRARGSRDQEITFDAAFDRMTLEEAWARYAQIDLRQALEQIAAGDHSALERAVTRAGHALRPEANFEDAFHHIMISRIEPRIGQIKPCVITKWPRQMACLARVCEADHLFADRFEIYCDHLELANAYAELTDPKEQNDRFHGDNLIRRELGKTELPISDQFVADLSHMPASAGIAMGFDRALMVICGVREIQNVHPLPWME